MTGHGKTKCSMNKDNKTLRKVIELTEKDKIRWSVFMITKNVITYKSRYHITDNKYIDMAYYSHTESQYVDYIVFVYVNVGRNHKTEIKDISPINKFSPINQWRLKRMFAKLHTDIRSNQDDKVNIVNDFISARIVPILKVTPNQRTFIFKVLSELNLKGYDNKDLTKDIVSHRFLIIYKKIKRVSFIDSVSQLTNNYIESLYLDTRDYKIKKVRGLSK